MNTTTLRALGGLAVAIACALPALGCSENAFCFTDCATDAGRDAGPDVRFADGFNQGDDADACNSPFGCDAGSDVAPDVCVPAVDGREVCNGLDDDCDGLTDEPIGNPGPRPGGIDFTHVKNCGTCANDCVIGAANVEGLVCSGVPDAGATGATPGVCDYGRCEQDFYDLDGNRANGCEYYCPWNPTGANTTDPGEDKCGRDDDCDGVTDEDVGVCDDIENCGKCGYVCVIPNGTPTCVSTRASPTEACTFGPEGGNTHCRVASCIAGYYDIDTNVSNGCEYRCDPTGQEVCDTVDNDCDGKIDFADPDLVTQDTRVGQACFGDPRGECGAAVHQGVTKCISGAIRCCDVLSANNPPTAECDATTGPQVLKPGEASEVCNGKDDDCDGTNDDSPVDEGSSCGSSLGDCSAGVTRCQNGTPVCTGATGPQAEACDGRDNNCDGAIDGTLPSAPLACTTDAECANQGTANVCLSRSPLNPNDKVCTVPAPLPPGTPSADCDVPPPPPPGVMQPCRKGTLVCSAGSVVCRGSIRPSQLIDNCGEDSNCDGVLSVTVDTQTDVANCGSCGNDCRTVNAASHGVWACQAGSCVRTACDPGFINCDTVQSDCERACTVTSATELCNGADDNCDCSVDNGIATPSATQVCGVSTSASDPGCTTNVAVACTSGAWRCTFNTPGFCTGGNPPSCATTQDTCDARDNNCNGVTDEPYKLPVLTQGYIGQPCNSDDGLPPPGHGACRGTGVFQCATPATTRCNAVLNPAGAGPELCDDIDNDCDSVVDEPFSAKGTNATHYVRPAVTRITPNLWIYQYEASRPGATAIDPGNGNGYQSNPPAGETADATQACSAGGVVPWFNVTPLEGEQVCTARGGRLCSLADWQRACRATINCTRGYNPRTVGAAGACTTNQTASKFCNIGLFDFDGNPANGIRNGLLPTGSTRLQNCWADWSGLEGNPAANDDIRDILGNLREVTKNGTIYTLMGGAFNTQVEDGASCDFTFFSVDQNFKLFDMGFRCCFDSNPG